jgi:aerotolerance regulator-like protein
LIDLEFQRAFAFAFLALPVLLWILARRPRPPRERATATLSVWREVLEQNSAVPTSRGRGVPLGLYWILLALVLGTVALAGPHRPRLAEPEWRVVLDTRPQMFLPWQPEDPNGSSERRIDVALARADEWISGPAQWMRFDGDAWQVVRGDRPPADWLRASNHDSESVPWSEVDRADSLWITDRVPEPRAASWVASGGARVDGLVGRRDGRLVTVLDGELVVDGVPDPARLSFDGGLPRELRRLTELWARERGMRSLPFGTESDLVIRVTPARDGTSVVRGPGWELTAAAAEAPTGRALWRDADGATVLAGSAGELQLALRDPLRLEGDRRALGVAWIDALEAHVAPPRGAVGLRARRAAGEGGAARGAGPGPPADSAPGTLVSWLALAAGLCAALGLRAGALRI